MEPIPETVEAIEEFGPFIDDGDLVEELVALGERVRAVVPDCVGMSVSIMREGVTFTLVATSEEIAALDAIQYLDGGPCVEAINETIVLETDNDTMNEQGWHLFAGSTAARGIASTLSLPVLDGERVVGGFNLYASSVQAFTGLHKVVAHVLGAWAGGAVTNADLSFSTRQTAQGASQTLRQETNVNVAAGVLAKADGLSFDEARRWLEAAAARAGVSAREIAELVIEVTALPPTRDDQSTL